MSDEIKDTTPPPAAPAVDVDAIVNQAAKRAEEIANARAAKVAAELEERQKRAARVLAGEPEEGSKPKLHAVHEMFARDPEGFFEAVTAQATERAQKSVAQQKEEERITRSVTAEYASKYPDITEHSEIINDVVMAQVARGVPLEDALKSGFEKVVKKFKLSESSASDSAAFGLPLGGARGFTKGSANSKQSNQDFVASMRKAASAVRTKQ